MEEYYFLFGLALVWTVFAVVQDLRKTEVSNWLNFSFVGIALAYRGFYSIYLNDYRFFLFGVIGVAVFYVIANLFYYGKVFAGGDAKLLIAYGAILPIVGYGAIASEGLGFIISLLLIGVVYTLIYGAFLAYRNRKRFSLVFNQKMINIRYVFVISLLIILGMLLLAEINGLTIGLMLVLILLPFLYVFVMALDSCMIKLVSPEKLMEGDWLVENVRAGQVTIRKSVHGLNWKEIDLLRRAGKKVLIKYGIPFTPAFLLTLIFMVFFYLVLSKNFVQFLAFLF